MQYILLAILLFVGVIESIRNRKLTAWGAVAGGVIGFFIFIGSGWVGIAMLALFFLAGTIATAWKQKQKAAMGMMQERGGQRTLGQVLANAGVAGVLGLLSLFLPQHGNLFAFMIAATFSSAMADTLSSELGSLYGRKFYNILTFKKDQRGLDGVVSWEGTGIGVLGSAVIAVLYSLGFGWGEPFLFLLIAGTIGNLTDSILGAALERKHRITNNAVNFSNTLLAAIIAGVLYGFV